MKDSKRNIYLGKTKMNLSKNGVKGHFTGIENEAFYQIRNYHEMPDFFMSVVSNSDHWMFLSSNGSLTAGRKDRNNALFPYYTVDKIHDYKNRTGSKTILLVEKQGKTCLWEPFTSESEKIYRIERNLFKSIYGNKVIFEEVNKDLNLAFRYGWYNSEKFGFVKKSMVTNPGHEPAEIEIVDGIQNILPYGIDYTFQNEFSNLLDAYKKNELLKETGLGIFTLSAIPVDRAEPSEALKATTVWHAGLDQKPKMLLSDRQTDHFRKGKKTETERDIRACRGAYFVHFKAALSPESRKQWMILAEINQDSSDVNNLNHFIKTENDPAARINRDIAEGTSRLVKMVGRSDGLQMSNDKLACARHFSNTLFNVMRGGIFPDNYFISSGEFKKFVRKMNKKIHDESKAWFKQLPPRISCRELQYQGELTGNPDLIRFTYEYLPLTFSRRHGDPSRPWNKFSIDTKNEDGSPKIHYEGNWRDIFQNWESLGFSYPEFAEGMISRFLNASTADGYNPYRITLEGIDWEVPDPDDPWAYIGYWGDHQIIYLQKLLELSDQFHPGKLEELLTKEIFVYANVPYRLKRYDQIVQNPKDTIVFDQVLNNKIHQRSVKNGADERLLHTPGRTLCRANMVEKILVTLLSKLSHFIPEAGIWLNTQRPEWNDANNALVGNGTSMVTLYYLRRFLTFWASKWESTSKETFRISGEVSGHFNEINAILIKNRDLLKTGFSDATRKHVAQSLGEAGSRYRNQIYAHAFSKEKATLNPGELTSFFRLALEYLDQSIKVNRRKDSLYHAYNLISFSKTGISIRPLYEMLEGQVAVLSSGYLSARESLEVLNALKKSRMYRADQNSYMLYPDRDLPRFTEKNIIPDEYVRKSALLKKCLADQNQTLISRDAYGKVHFNGTFRNAEVLKDALTNRLPAKYASLVDKEKDDLTELYESLFDHQSFTGRSGTFFGYEGLGSIYWHMVSKLLLAVQEFFFRAVNEKAGKAVQDKLKDHYNEIKAGIGLHKPPDAYGAFPTDAYSHTPAGSGVRQPGMTGQVKEDILTRMGELGLRVHGGKIELNPLLMHPGEWLDHERTFEYYSPEGKQEKIRLGRQQNGFTFCQVPFIYSAARYEKTEITSCDGKKTAITERVIPAEISKKIFERSGEILKVELFLPHNQ